MFLIIYHIRIWVIP